MTIHIATDAQREAVFALRVEVFVEEQKVPPEIELDEEDAHAIHILAEEDGVAVGCARLLVQDCDAHIGRLAVKKSRRGEGIGAAICRFLIDYCRRAGYTRIWLNSQLHAAGFYEKLGFRREGEVFMEAGIAHIRMAMDANGDMDVAVRAYTSADAEAAVEIWNTVVRDGVAFPQLDCLDPVSGDRFFHEQTYTGIAYERTTGAVVGLYILHPNNIGRCGHIGNASYAVHKDVRGRHIGEKLVTDCLAKAHDCGFRLMQFNAVVKSNHAALHLYEKLGFIKLGEIPGGFLLDDGSYADIILFYREV